MTRDTADLSPFELEVIDAQASVLMKRGISALAAVEPNSAAEALTCFDSALELRRRLPVEAVPRFAYGLAACFLNRGEALMQSPDLNAEHRTAALHAYDEAILLLRNLPLEQDPKFRRRLAIAYQNRGLVLQAENPSDIAQISAAFWDAITVLDHDELASIPDRQYLAAAVWSNLANACASASDAQSIVTAQNAARRAIALVSDLEMNDANAAEVGLKARHVLCQAIAPVLSWANGEIQLDNIHKATDAADDGLAIARQWEQKGVHRFRNIAYDLFNFGARVYARFQPQFLEEFVRDNSDLEGPLKRRVDPAYGGPLHSA